MWDFRRTVRKNYNRRVLHNYKSLNISALQNKPSKKPT